MAVLARLCAQASSFWTRLPRWLKDSLGPALMLAVLSGSSRVSIGADGFGILFTAFTGSLRSIVVTVALVSAQALWVLAEPNGGVFRYAGENATQLALVFVVTYSVGVLAGSMRYLIDAKTSELLRQREAMRLRDEFITVASHELRTPLTTLSLQLQFMQRELKSISPENGRMASRLQEARRQSARMAKLIDNLIWASQIDGKHSALNLQVSDLSALLKDALPILETDAQRNGCHLQVYAEEKIPVRVDPERIEQVLGNLITNSIKFAPRQPIEVEVMRERDVARLSVRDRGKGISRSDQQRIFARFARVASARNYGGLGLGLFVSKRIIEAHGGRIHVESARDDGTEFIIHLPLAESREAFGNA